MSERVSRNELTQECHDDKVLYCRMLGHDLTFKYCRNTGTGLFCRKIFDCWHLKLEVGTYIKTFFSDEQTQAVLRPPAPKVHTLLGLIDKAKQGD